MFFKCPHHMYKKEVPATLPYKKKQSQRHSAYTIHEWVLAGNMTKPLVLLLKTFLLKYIVFFF